MTTVNLTKLCVVIGSALFGIGCCQTQADENEKAPLKLGPGYVTLKMSADGQHAELVEPRDARDKRIANLEKRVTALELSLQKLSGSK